jgi:hypothetical protein
MKTEPMTSAERDARDESFRAALRAVPPFAGLETLEHTALALRRVWVRFHPHMAAVFNLTGHYPI